MGKYEAVRAPLAKRIIMSMDDSLAKRGVRRPHLPRITRAKSFPVVGFFLVLSFTLVYSVDPYSGNLASASTVQVFDPQDRDDQGFVFEEALTVSFERGGFRVISGTRATSYFVLAAAQPEDGTAKAYALEYISQRDWGMDQFSCLVNLWTKESNWRHLAKNPSSGAYGIPQALPGSKMATEGADWMTNYETQVRWGVKYIAARYKTPCGAWAYFLENNWY
jgi:hypothetical protein